MYTLIRTNYDLFLLISSYSPFELYPVSRYLKPKVGACVFSDVLRPASVCSCYALRVVTAIRVYSVPFRYSVSRVRSLQWGGARVALHSFFSLFLTAEI